MVGLRARGGDGAPRGGRAGGSPGGPIPANRGARPRADARGDGRMTPCFPSSTVTKRFGGLVAVDDAFAHREPGFDHRAESGPTARARPRSFTVDPPASSPRRRGRVLFEERDVTAVPAQPARAGWGIARTFQIVQRFAGALCRETSRSAPSCNMPRAADALSPRRRRVAGRGGAHADARPSRGMSLTVAGPQAASSIARRCAKRARGLLSCSTRCSRASTLGESADIIPVIRACGRGG